MAKIVDKALDIAAQGAGGAIGAGLGMLTANWQDRRQVKQQQKLTDQQVNAQKQMGKYNQQLALDMWEKTNYEAQRKQMEKAGLNVGLMYGGGGAGGGTTSTPTGSVGAGSAASGSGEIGMGMQAGMQMQLMKAQKENIEADTANKRANTPGEGQTEGKIGAETENIKTDTAKKQQDIQNLKAQEILTKTQQSIAELERQVKNLTVNDEVSIKQALRDTMIYNAKIVENAKEVSTETKKATIDEIRGRVAEQAVRIATGKSNMQVNDAQIQKISQDIMSSMVGLTQEQRRLRIQEIANEYNTGQAAGNKRNVETVKLWVNMVTDFIESIMPE